MAIVHSLANLIYIFSFLSQFKRHVLRYNYLVALEAR